MSRIMKLVGVCLAVSALSGCGIQRMEGSAQEVKSEWASALFLTMEQLDTVSKAWPKAGEAQGTDGLESAKNAVRASMQKWQDIPSEHELKAGVQAMEQAAVAVDARLAKAKADGEKEFEKVAKEVAEFRRREEAARGKYTIAARTYNDILRLYPSRLVASLMMKEPAVTFEDSSKMAGAVTHASMLDSLGVARHH